MKVSRGGLLFWMFVFNCMLFYGMYVVIAEPDYSGSSRNSVADSAVYYTDTSSDYETIRYDDLPDSAKTMCNDFVESENAKFGSNIEPFLESGKSSNEISAEVKDRVTFYGSKGNPNQYFESGVGGDVYFTDDAYRKFKVVH